MQHPGFWDDQEKAQKLTQRVADLKDRVAAFEEVERLYGDLAVMVELGEEDADLAGEAETELAGLQRKLEKMELEVLLSGPYDSNNAILALHAGAGGTEAQDWVDMLLRMYTRWAEERGYRVNVLDMLPGDEAGTKSATISVEGLHAYGYLKSEKGVHRLVRISPFDTAGRRHTSFRSGGAGGQHVNKTDSAVRITHMPTGIVVQCQSERSQLTNRNTAMKLLKARLVDIELQKKEEELASMRGEQREIAWGSQIRSYVFHPYRMVKDHRTNTEVGNIDSVMDGNIDTFISAYLQHIARG